MKNPNIGRNEKQNNPMFGKCHQEKSKALMSESQRLRLENIRKLIYSIRSDQLDNKIRMLIAEALKNN